MATAHGREAEEIRLRRYFNCCLKQAERQGARTPGNTDLDAPEGRRAVAQAILPVVLSTAIEWADEHRSVCELVEIGNRALFTAMRAYRAEEDGELMACLAQAVERSIIDA